MCNFLFADAKLVALRTELNEAAAIKAVTEFFQAGLNNLKSK